MSQPTVTNHTPLQETKTPRTMTGLIIVLTIILISGLWIYVISMITGDYGRTVSSAGRETMNLTIAFEEHVRRVISDADKDLLYLQDVYQEHGIVSPVFTSALKNIAKDPNRSTVLVLDSQGNIIANSLYDSARINYADRDYFRVHEFSPSEELVISRTIRGRQTGQQVIPLSRRIYNPDGSFGGIVYIGLLRDSILSFYDSVDLGPNQWISLSGKDGSYLALRTDLNSLVTSNMQSYSPGEQTQSGVISTSKIEITPLDGIERVMSYRSMPDYPLTVAVGKSVEAVLTNHQQRTKDYLLGALLISSFIAFYCGFLIDKAAKQGKFQDHLEELIVKRTRELQIERDRLSSLVNSLTDEVWFSNTSVNTFLLIKQLQKTSA